jgi:Tol biopolymer transport system component
VPEIGQTISHYRILKKIGQGGMGEVYLADDLNLNRKVALKFLPDAFAGDPERMARFEREAKVLASLNHTNIAVIFGLEQAEEKRFLALELVEGETLTQRIGKGALPLDEAVAICRQIAEGLEAAHEKGVIHRDLKPANVMITQGNRVKILDFGLAKALSDEMQRIDSSQSPTLTEAMTRPGVILGTAAYMSPEQAKGKSVDKRADIWALGCILYECLTGKRAFEGETVTETLAAILKGEPDWNSLPETTPSSLRFVLRRCLEKDMSGRFRDAADVRIEIEEARDIGLSIVVTRRPWFAWGATVVLFFIALTLGFFLYRLRNPADTESMRFQIALPKKTAMHDWGTFALSPDGRRLAMAATGSDGVAHLWIRSMDSLEARQLPGTESHLIPPFFWSPDSRFVAFCSEGKLKKIDVSGGQPQTICDLSGVGFTVGGSWNRDDVIIFGVLSGALMRVSAAGGVASSLTKLNPARQETSHDYPVFLDDGRHFLYFSRAPKPENCGIYWGSLDLKPEEQGSKRILATPSESYIPLQVFGQGYMLYLREQTLVAQAFDQKRMELTGEPMHLAEQVSSFSASASGVLVYGDSIQSGETAGQELIWVNPKGKKLGSASAPGRFDNFRLSPDEKRVVFDRPGSEFQQDIWILDLVRGVPLRLTFDPACDNLPIWSPDGLRVLFPSNRNGSFDLYLKSASGTGKDELLIRLGTPTGWSTDWSRDGRFILYQIPGAGTGQDLWISPQFGDKKSFPYLQTEFNEQAGVFSPDGKWIAYVSNESGRDEIYVQSFPRSGSKYQISTGGGSEPSWARDGTRLLYVATGRNLVAVPITIKPSFEPGLPEPLISLTAKAQLHSYAVTADGQRFLTVVPAVGEALATVTVVVNWPAALKK